jgi:hypothetical protein
MGKIVEMDIPRTDEGGWRLEWVFDVSGGCHRGYCQDYSDGYSISGLVTVWIAMAEVR